MRYPKYLFNSLFLLLITFAFLNNQILAQGNYIFVDADAAGLNNGSSWENAFNNLQDAIEISFEGDSIFVAEGTYYPDRGNNVTAGDRNASFVLKDGIVLLGGYKGNERFTKTFNNFRKHWRNWHKNKTIISGDLLNNDNDNVVHNEPTRSDNSYHIFISNESRDSTLEVNGFHVQGGNANFPNLLGSIGGAFYLGNSNMQIKNCVFSNNTASDRGGALFIPAGNPKIKFVTFINNHAKNGGAVYMTGNDHLNHPTFAYIHNSYFYNNHATENGGAVYAAFVVNPSMVNCVFLENSAVTGGGMYTDFRSYPIIASCTFFKNAATTSGGGYALSAGTIMNCIFRENTAPASAQIFLEREPNDPLALRNFRNSTIQGGFQGNQILDFDPEFVDAGNPAGEDSIYGTSDDGLRLQSTSRAINAGLAHLYEFSDIRGWPRQTYNIQDMGAYEYPKIEVDYAQLYQELKNGGYTLVYRHGMTDWQTTDQPGFENDIENCALQRNLAWFGREQVQYLGEVIKLLDIPVDTSISSPACRCKETGVAITGGAKPKLEWMLTDTLTRPAKIEDLNRIPPEGLNSVIATHMNVIAVVMNFPMGEVNEGDMVVVKANGTGFEEIGQFTTDTWERIIELIPNDGTINVEERSAPQDFVLFDNYPNPFNPTTTIEFVIPNAQQVSLKVYDTMGKKVTELVNEYKPAGDYKIKFDASGLSSGVYFYTLSAGNFSKTKKLALVK